jgi:hypothetical protein
MLPVIETFIYRVWEISHQNGLTLDDRNKYYKQAVARLKKETDNPALLDLAEQYIAHQEGYRTPPPGWDPDDKLNNLLMFHKMSAIGLSIDLKLMSYGFKDCD